MAQLLKEELARYAHSPVHSAVSRKDHVGLQHIVAGLPQLAQGDKIYTEEDAIAEEQRAEALSKELDRRDVPGRQTPLHLAVRMRDAVAVEILLAAGADSNLQNEQGWSALQEAICVREEAIACMMTRYYPPMAWAKWCRRVPRIIGTMKKMIDFYMEVTFHFESSVIPFIGKIAPSDTYRIWKKGSNMRADMTIEGFDGFKIKRSDQSFVFLGEGSNARKLPSGSLCILKHKKRCIFNALDGAGRRPTESEAAREVADLSRTNMYRPGLDVTQAVLMPQLNWMRQERSEMVGNWQTKLYDMHHVLLSLRSRRVPGALTDEELFGSGEVDVENVRSHDDFAELLDEEERGQLDKALDTPSSKFSLVDSNVNRKDKNRNASTKAGIKENEYTMGLRPVLWLASNFPLKTEEMLPLLDILANKVKAVRRLREVLTTKLPAGTFPVKVAIPVVPTIRVIVTFTKFEQLKCDEMFTAATAEESDDHENSWFLWMKGTTNKVIETPVISKDHSKEAFDPFAIPGEYAWISNNASKHGRRSREWKTY